MVDLASRKAFLRPSGLDGRVDRCVATAVRPADPAFSLIIAALKRLSFRPTSGRRSGRSAAEEYVVQTAGGAAPQEPPPARRQQQEVSALRPKPPARSQHRPLFLARRRSDGQVGFFAQLGCRRQDGASRRA